MSNRVELSRRSVLQVMAGAGASLMIGSFPAACSGAHARNEKTGAPKAFEPSAFLKIDPDGAVTVTVSKSDMGQGIRTTFAMLVAEELDADWTKVQVTQAPADPVYGGQGTGGSGSTRSMHKRLRQIGAGARVMLVAAAAEKWGVDATQCTTENGKVLHKASGRSIPYAELTTAAAGMQVPDGDVPLKDKSKFSIIGKPTKRVDNPAVVTGRAIYGQDVTVEGTTYAVVLRRPAFGASVSSVDDTAAKQVPGVVDVVQIPSGVAVVGANTWAAIAGREALKVDWNLGPNAGLATSDIRASLKAAVKDHLDMPAGAKVVEATYDLPYLAHATMEPMNAVADVRDGRCTVWAPTQAPDSARQQVARMLDIPVENVTLNVTLLGGGFGRRFAADFIADAVAVSRAVKKPVKLLWTRDDDMKNDHYRPMSHHSCKGAVDASGNPVGWSHQAILAGGRGRGGDNFGNAGIPYAIEAKGLLRGGAPAPIPTGAWRSVEHSQIDVVNECFIDELAHAAGQDPFEFRRKAMSNERLKKVLEVAAEKAGWGKALPKGKGRGIACFDGYGSCAAHVVEVSVTANKITVDRVVCAVDPGLAINPKGIEAQMQGAFIDGLSTALKVEVTIEKGGVVQSSFLDYDWARMGDTPQIEVHIVESGGDPGGMGEVGYPSAPAAIANAIFAATGRRVRKFPIRLKELA